ncbi:MAG: c-type cytochrome [Azoarcus sp.]|nr:c-type cytochrome [Azoarcus sp.]
MTADPRPEPKPRRSLLRGLMRLLVVLPWLVIVLGGGYAAWRFLPDEAVVHADVVDHFKYGSTGGERESGFPYWIWQALPQVCPEHLPGKGYASLGMIYEAGRDLPIGVSKRRHLGIDRVFLNCAACHTSTVREAPDAAPRVITGMPAHRFDIRAFETFFFNCAAGPKFSRDYIVPEIDRLAGGISLIDRYLVYPVAIALMRERLLMLRGRFEFVFDQPEWGPGRVDTFNSAKVLFNFPMKQLPPHELLGASDFPSIWNQRKRFTRDDGQRMELHWDGNNTHTEERNKSAAFGTGTTPPTIDLAAIGRVEAWLLDVAPPPWPWPVDEALAARGAPLYAQYCAGCHGANGQDFRGAAVGHVTPIAQIGTDRARLDSYSRELAVNQATLYAGYPHRFQHFRKTQGYANMPLDGIWLRAPYLHNGSVPTLRDLLEPAALRPARFARGSDVYDPQRVGFAAGSAAETTDGAPLFLFDTSVPGNGNAGHEGPSYGTDLPATDKDALVEYLKTF